MALTRWDMENPKIMEIYGPTPEEAWVRYQQNRLEEEEWELFEEAAYHRRLCLKMVVYLPIVYAALPFEIWASKARRARWLRNNNESQTARLEFLSKKLSRVAKKIKSFARFVSRVNPIDEMVIEGWLRKR